MTCRPSAETSSPLAARTAAKAPCQETPRASRCGHLPLRARSDLKRAHILRDMDAREVGLKVTTRIHLYLRLYLSLNLKLSLSLRMETRKCRARGKTRL